MVYDEKRRSAPLPMSETPVTALLSLSLSYLQEDFEFEGQIPFQDPRSTSESTTPMEGENMGGWWPEYSTPDTGVRATGQFTLACTRHLHIGKLKLSLG